MCVMDSMNLLIRLKSTDVLTIYSNNYPSAYPTYRSAFMSYQTCMRRISTSDGTLHVQILESSISVEDTIGIGAGHYPAFATTVYATNTGMQMPQRNNHPKHIYVLPTILGTFLWIVFGVGEAEWNKHLHQPSTINARFVLEISVVENHGKAFCAVIDILYLVCFKKEFALSMLSAPQPFSYHAVLFCFLFFVFVCFKVSYIFCDTNPL